MGKIVNLNRARKTRAKAADKTRAEENAARFGRTKLQKKAEADLAEKARRDLDGHLRE